MKSGKNNVKYDHVVSVVSAPGGINAFKFATTWYKIKRNETSHQYFKLMCRDKLTVT